MKPIRVVVCGTTFGRIYASGIQNLPDRFTLVAVLSRGSAQSRRVAEELGVPLHTTIASLPDFELACVVVRSGIVGGAGTRLALELLSCGKDVLMEHPIHRDDAIACYREASRRRRRFWLNTFYRWGPTVSRYLQMTGVLRERFGIMAVDVECSVHFLYSALDVVGCITGGFTPWEFDTEARHHGVFSTLHGTIRDTPVCVRVVNRTNPARPDDFAHVGHRVTTYTSGGNLVLTETDGQIIWHPNTTSPRDANGVLAVGADESLSSFPLHETLTVEPWVTRRDQYERIWPATVAACLDNLHGELSRTSSPAHQAEHLLALCSVWARIGQLLGGAEPLEAEMPAAPLTLGDITRRMAGPR